MPGKTWPLGVGELVLIVRAGDRIGSRSVSENEPRASKGMLDGKNLGKQLVKIADEVFPFPVVSL